MRNEQLNTDASTEQRSAVKKGLSLLDRSPVRRDDVFDERTFRSILALERRRAERSRQSFILMLVDSSALNTEQYGSALSEQLVSVVSLAIRDSDVIGWYEGGTVVGVIFTGVGGDQHSNMAEALRSKILALLQDSLGNRVASQLTISIHVFPERWDKDSTDRTSDIKLYPDIGNTAAKKRFLTLSKRVCDVLGSAAFLLIHSPLLVAVALAIKLTSKGPVIYKQARLGQFGTTFHCLKFRTMYTNSDPKIHREYIENFIAGKTKEEKRSETGIYKITNDPRVTPVGRFLRRTSLDEFPQFWNVLRGEMSLVGPRPPLLYEFEAYDIWHRRRILDFKPGVTGLWQVFGRSRTSFDDMVRMDVRYCQRWSLWLDLRILLATPLAVITGHGAY